MERIQKWMWDNGAILLLIFFCLLLTVFLSLSTDSFFSWKNMVNILEANSYRMLLAMGMMFIIASGAIDLSVGSTLSLSAVIMASVLVSGAPIWQGVVAGLLTGAALGALNGLLIHLTRINALIITLATAYLYRGLSLILTQGTPITKLPEGFRAFGCGDIWGMESGVIMAALAVLLLFPLFYHMKWGNYLTGLGGNPEALKRSGVPMGFYRITAFSAMGLLASLAGIIITARLNSAETNAGLNMEMDAICAVIMGGTALRGGKGNLPGTIVAVLLLGMIRNGLTLLSVSPYYQQFITGAILLAAVVIAELRERRQRIN